VEKAFAKMKASLRKNQRLSGVTGRDSEIKSIIEDEARKAMDEDTMRSLYRGCGYF